MTCFLFKCSKNILELFRTFLELAGSIKVLNDIHSISRDNITQYFPIHIYSQISVIRTPVIRNYWVIRRRWTVPNFFSIIYCNKTTNYSNFDYPKNSIFRSDSSVPIEESAIKLPFKIRSPKVTHGDHDFFVWSS